MSAQIVDVAICGGGPVGAALALALEAMGRSCTVLDARPANAMAKPDPRAIALSYGSRLVLERLGAWTALNATPITTIHVSQQGAFGRTVLTAEDENIPALGYVASLSHIDNTLRDACAGKVAVEHGARVGNISATADRAIVAYTQATADGKTTERDLEAKLVAIADGGRGDADHERVERDYGQVAVVADVTPREPHANRAWERFTRDGPVALLPKSRDYALVWSLLPQTAANLMQAPDDEFLAKLATAMNGKCGNFSAMSPRIQFPLGLRYRREVAGDRALTLGNAAQTLHPVAGQGLNLGLRDAWALAEVAKDAADCGDKSVLAGYAAQRRMDRFGAIRFTDLLARAFVVDSAAMRFGRGAALTLFDLLPPARHFLARRMIFGASAWP
jgi:2-octaprenyl-6-methoxyphenol hydroxylase